MRTSAIIISLSVLSFGTTVGKISWEAVQRSKKKLEKELSETIDTFANSADKTVLQKLKEMLPKGPEGEDPRMEKDIFFGTIERNKVAINILEQKIQNLKLRPSQKTKKPSCGCPRGKRRKKAKTIKELQKLLDSQKSIQKRWNRFMHH